MRDILLVGTGGFLGSVFRFLLGGAVTRASGASTFPYGTLAVNLLGCLTIGVLAGLAESRSMLSSETRLFLMTGLLGGFTTFSAFAYESYFLGRQNAWPALLANIGISAVAGLGAVWLGHRLAAG